MWKQNGLKQSKKATFGGRSGRICSAQLILWRDIWLWFLSLKLKHQLWSIFPMSRWGFACHLLGVLPSNHLWCFPSAPISCKQWREEEKNSQTAAQRANAFEMEHFLQNNESAESAVYTVMTKLLVHIRFVCHIYQTLMRERSEGQTPHDASQSRI